MSNRALIVAMLLVSALVACVSVHAEVGATRLALDGKWAEAKAATDAMATAPETLLLRGYASMQTGDYASAVGSFSRIGETEVPALAAWATRLVDQNRNSPVAHVLKGDVLARIGKYDDAIASLDEAIRLDSKSALAYDVRGVVKELMFKHDDAVADFQKSLDIDPKFTDALVNLGIGAILDGEYMTASYHLDKAAEISPDFALAYNARGVLNHQVRDWQGAERDLHKASALSPNLPFVSGNLKLLTWSTSHDEFKTLAIRGVERESSPYESSLECHPVDLGNGRTMNVWEIKNTQLTATQEGMDLVYLHIRDQEMKGSGMPPDWKPRILIAQHGMGGTAEKSKLNFARAAFSGGKDFVVYHDTSKEFRWTNPEAAVIPEEVTRRIERGVVAANHVYGEPASILVESEASRLFGVPKAGSVTFSSRARDGSLHPDFRIDTAVAYAVPFTDMGIDPSLRGRCKSITTISTDYNVAGLLPNATFKDTPTVRLTLPGGGAPTHADLCRERWRAGIDNPTWETAGMLYRGVDIETVQKHADSWQGLPRWFTIDSGDPVSTIDKATLSVWRSMLPNDRILISCSDRKRAERYAGAFFGGLDSPRVRWTAETDLSRISKLAIDSGCSYVAVMDPGKPETVDAPKRMPWDTWHGLTLPEVRSFFKDMDLIHKGYKLAISIADYEERASGGAGLPWAKDFAASIDVVSSIAEDVDSIGRGRTTSECLKTFEKSVGAIVSLASKDPKYAKLVPSAAFLGLLPSVLKDWKAVKSGEPNSERLSTFQKSLETAASLASRNSEWKYAKFAPAGTVDLISGAVKHWASGSLLPTPEIAEDYTDGILKLTVGFCVLVATLPRATATTIAAKNPKLAVELPGLAAEAAGFAAAVGRRTTQKQFYNGVRQQMVESYQEHLDQCRAANLEARTLSEMFPDLVVKVGFSAYERTVYDQQAASQNRWRDVLRSQGKTFPRADSSSADSTTRMTTRSPISKIEPKPREDDSVGYDPPKPLAWWWWQGPRPTPTPVDDSRDDRGGGPAGIGRPTNRLPSNASPAGDRGGVYMKTDVVVGEPADTSGMFGGETEAESTNDFDQPGLVAAYLIFCSFPVRSK